MTKLGVEIRLPQFTSCVSLEIACAEFVIPERFSVKLVLVYLYRGTCGNDIFGAIDKQTKYR